MTFLPTYKCDACEVESKAAWSGLPNWEVPDGWFEDSGKHFCEDCSWACDCGRCESLPSHQCLAEKTSKRSKEKAQRQDAPPKIIRNSARCKKCGDHVESEHRHDFVACKCGAIAVDGGHAYLRRAGYPEDFDDTSEVEGESFEK